MDQIYVLQLQKGKYYVGQTNNLDRRLIEHYQGNGSHWTKLYQPIRVIETKPLKSLLDEDTVTKEYMIKYGIDNVRGASYVTKKLSSSQYEVLHQIIQGANGHCYICGKDDHWAAQCVEKDKVEEKNEKEIKPAVKKQKMSSSMKDVVNHPEKPWDWTALSDKRNINTDVLFNVGLTEDTVMGRNISALNKEVRSEKKVDDYQLIRTKSNMNVQDIKLNVPDDVEYFLMQPGETLIDICNELEITHVIVTKSTGASTIVTETVDIKNHISKQEVLGSKITIFRGISLIKSICLPLHVYCREFTFSAAGPRLPKSIIHPSFLDISSMKNLDHLIVWTPPHEVNDFLTPIFTLKTLIQDSGFYFIILQINFNHAKFEIAKKKLLSWGRTMSPEASEISELPKTADFIFKCKKAISVDYISNTEYARFLEKHVD